LGELVTDPARRQWVRTFAIITVSANHLVATNAARLGLPDIFGQGVLGYFQGIEEQILI
jgi:hypothetical protein